MTSARATTLRSHTRTEVGGLAEGTAVRLCGFAALKLNDVSGEFDLADGAATVYVSPHADHPKAKAAARALGPEDVVQVVGVVHGEAPHAPGRVWIQAREVVLLSKARKLPLSPREKDFEAQHPIEERLKHRTLDLRRPVMQARLQARSAGLAAARAALAAREFMEVETPVLGPWGMSDSGAFKVPVVGYRSFGLFQTHQLYKQLLMAGGCDRIFQFARCFRDERVYGPLHQPEYTALDVELAWASEADVYAVVDDLLRGVWRALRGEEMGPLRRLTHAQALDTYGSAQPDLRYDLPLVNVTDLCRRSTSSLLIALLGTLTADVRALRVPARYAAAFTDATLRGLFIPLERRYHGVRVPWLRVADTTRFEGALAEAFDVHLAEDLCERTDAGAGDLLVLVVGAVTEVARAVGGLVRAALAHEAGLDQTDQHALVWIHEIPFFTYRLSAHAFGRNRHPLTRVMDEDLPGLEEVLAASREADAKELERHRANPTEDATGELFHRMVHDFGAPALETRLGLRSMGYELVLDGAEIATGSIRNHDAEMQRKVLELLTGSPVPPDDLRPLLDALELGAPPHGGLSIGFDRLVARLMGVEDLKEMLAFPKDERGRCHVTQSPSPMQPLHLQVLFGVTPRPADSEETDRHVEIDYGGDTSQVTVRVGFSFEPRPVVVGQPVQFVDRSESVSPIIDRVWSCPAIKWRSTLKEPTKRFGAPGEYVVTLTLFTADGKRHSASATVVVTRPLGRSGWR